MLALLALPLTTMRKGIRKRQPESDPSTRVLTKDCTATSFTPEVIARLIRITSGNLRLLTQIERVLSVNAPGYFSRNRRTRSRQLGHR